MVRFDVSSKSGSFRGLVEPIPGSRDVAVVLVPLRDVDATMTRLYWIEGIATAVLLLLAGGLALWLVRVGLHPLAHITDTADAVAGGDLDRRVDISGGPEVAHLGRALNSAFDARAASEQSLRAFISDASHELRTPLTSIRGYAELLRAGALQGEEATGRAAARASSTRRRVWVCSSTISCRWPVSTRVGRSSSPTWISHNSQPTPSPTRAPSSRHAPCT